MNTRGKNRLGAVVALVAMLTMVLAAPAGATGWGEERSWTSGLVQRVLVWLGVAPSSGVVENCDQGAHIDPNGCPRMVGKQGASIDPNGILAVGTASATTDQGLHIDPNGNH